MQDDVVLAPPPPTKTIPSFSPEPLKPEAKALNAEPGTGFAATTDVWGRELTQACHVCRRYFQR